jgi:pyruvate kinase
MKYIAVVNPKMDNDEISSLIAKGIAGALFEISHENYSAAARLIASVKELAARQNKPISIIQDVSNMQDPLDLQFGLRNGVHWVASHDPKHLKMTRGLDKLAGLIFKGRNLPKGMRVDSVMAENFLDPDAIIDGKTHIKHLVTPHKDQQLLDSLLDMAGNSDSHGIAVSDLELAKALAWRRSGKKIIFAPKDHSLAHKAALYAGIQPIFARDDLNSVLRSSRIFDPNQRILDARNIKHVAINLV